MCTHTYGDVTRHMCSNMQCIVTARLCCVRVEQMKWIVLNNKKKVFYWKCFMGKVMVWWSLYIFTIQIFIYLYYFILFVFMAKIIMLQFKRFNFRVVGTKKYLQTTNLILFNSSVCASKSNHRCTCTRQCATTTKFDSTKLTVKCYVVGPL